MKQKPFNNNQRDGGTVLLLSLSDFGLGRARYLALALSELGYNVTVLCNKPVYTGNLVSGDELLNSRIHLKKLPTPPIPYTSIFNRLVFYIWLMFITFLYMFRYRHVDIIYVRHPHPFLDFSAIMFKKMLRVKATIISDITDLWPDVIEYVDANKLLKKLFITIGHAVNSFVYGNIDLVITHNEVMQYILRARSRKNVHVLYGVVDLNKFKPVPKDVALRALPRRLQGMLEHRFIVLYAGILSVFQDPSIIVDIAERIQGKDIVFLIVGAGPFKSKVIDEITRRSLENVVVLDPLPHDLMPLIYNCSDLTMVLPPDLSNKKMYRYFLVTLPKKLIEYSACGKPILTTTPPCVASFFVEKWNAGFWVNPYDVDAAAKTINSLNSKNYLLEETGRNARLMALKFFSVNKATEIIRDIINNHIKARR